MKIYHFLMLMICINIGIGIVSLSQIYDIGMSYYTPVVSVLVALFIGFVGAVAAGGILSMFRMRTADTAVYVLFGGIFWTLWGNTSLFILGLMTQMTTSFPEPLLSLSLGILFTGVQILIIALFIFGLVQMVRGGMEGME